MKRDLDLILKKTIEDENGCWIWQGKIYNTGYGCIWIDGKDYTVHRTVGALVYGPLTEDDFVCHVCDKPPCCNPDHLFIGTQKDNIQDCVRKKRHRPSFCRGEDAGPSKLTWAEVESIRYQYDKGLKTQIELAEEFGVIQPTISQICRRVTWKR